MWLPSGVSFAGALTAGLTVPCAADAGPPPVVLSDRLPRHDLIVSISETQFEVTKSIDRAIRSAHLQSVELVTLL